MKTPRVRLRSTAYHMVEASEGASIRSHGRSGGASADAIPASIS